MATEIERKFLVTDKTFKQQAVRTIHIRQAYFCIKDGKSVRIRIADDKAYLTIKGASSTNGLSRYEWEKEIAVADALDLLKMCEAGEINKIRHLIPMGKHCYEVDEFFGDNEGLIVAELELASEDEVFEKPNWLGQEVTGNPLFYNASLRKFPYKEWPIHQPNK